MEEYSIAINKNLKLRAPKISNSFELSSIYSDAETMNMIGAGVQIQEEVELHLKNVINGFKNFTSLYFILHDDQLNTSIGFFDIYYKNYKWQIEFAIDTRFRNRGYCSLAMKTLIKWLEECGLDKLYANVLTYNKTSISILEKVGFTKTHQKVTFSNELVNTQGYEYMIELN